MGGNLSKFCCCSSCDDDVTVKDGVSRDGSGQFDNPGYDTDEIIQGQHFEARDLPFRYVVGNEDVQVITNKRFSHTRGEAPTRKSNKLTSKESVRYTPSPLRLSPPGVDADDRRTSYVNITQREERRNQEESIRGSTTNLSTVSDQITSDYIATASHKAQTEVELSFNEGDRFVSSAETDNGNWLYVISLRTHGSGYVSRDHVISAPRSSHPAEKEFYFGNCSKAECAEKLQRSTPGSYLIRDSETRNGVYVLAVRDNNDVSPIRNYRISIDVVTGRISISPHQSFPTLDLLIKHYKSPLSSFLCCPLTTPLVNQLVHSPHHHDNKDTHAWEVDRGSLALTEKLGDGSFGIVWKGVWRGTTEVAVKMLKIGNGGSEEFLAEAEVMKHLEHPNILRLYGMVTSERPIYIITEYMPHGNLSKYLKDGEGRNCDLTACLDIALQVASGMRYLEKKQFIHCDLRAANVLVGESTICKIADFGLTRALSISDCCDTKQGERFPIRWTAPEAIHTLQFTLKSDVWSYGVLLYEILTKGSRPYQNFNHHDLVGHLTNGYRLPKPTHPDIPCPDSLYQLMLKCWDRDHEKRPAFGSIQNHLNSLLR